MEAQAAEPGLWEACEASSGVCSLSVGCSYPHARVCTQHKLPRLSMPQVTPTSYTHSHTRTHVRACVYVSVRERGRIIHVI